jgi:hypothetical protein
MHEHVQPVEEPVLSRDKERAKDQLLCTKVRPGRAQLRPQVGLYEMR